MSNLKDIFRNPLKRSQRRSPTIDFYANWRGSSSGTRSIFQGRGITVSHAFKVVQRLTGQFLTRSIGFVPSSRFERDYRWARTALAQSLFCRWQLSLFWPKHRVVVVLVLVHVPPLLKLLRFFDNFSRGACTAETFALLCRKKIPSIPSLNLVIRKLQVYRSTSSHTTTKCCICPKTEKKAIYIH